METGTLVGKTKTQGWEVGVSKTFPMDADKAWTLLMSDAGLRAWFGAGVAPTLEKNALFVTDEGTRGRVVSFLPNRMVRMRWQPAGWDVESTLQVRATPAGTKARISFHHEKMQTSEQREQMRRHWQQVMERLESIAV